MKVLCVGGGSGGHVTPVLAVINELSQLTRDLDVMFVCDKAFESQSRGIMKHAHVPINVKVISAGKLRRYHNISFLKQLLDFPTIYKNGTDGVKILTGFTQSLALLRSYKPDVVFAKGGYVCLPLGFAASLLRIPLVIHDSDTRPGLTNKILSRYATKIATGSPLENYSYPPQKTTYTGVPIDGDFHVFTTKEQMAAKRALGIESGATPLVVVTGGGLGAKSINDSMVSIADQLLEHGYAVYHVTGKKQFSDIVSRVPKKASYKVVEFVYKDMVTVLGAADVVVSRGSATFLQELAALAKPTIIVPAHHLGDQNKNAAVYEKAESAVVLTDNAIASDPKVLLDSVVRLVEKKTETDAMVERFNKFARPHAARDVAQIIYSYSGEAKA